MRLVPFAPEHDAALISWSPDPDTLLLWAGRQLTFPLTQDQLDAHRESARRTGAAILYTALDDGDRPVGHGEIGRIEEGTATLMRVVIAPGVRGRGIGVALVQALVEEAFGPLDLDRLILNVFVFNEAALRCYTTCGFRFLSLRPEPWIYRGQPERIHTMELLRPPRETRP